MEWEQEWGICGTKVEEIITCENKEIIAEKYSRVKEENWIKIGIKNKTIF
jgi:hypothetical protein